MLDTPTPACLSLADLACHLDRTLGEPTDRERSWLVRIVATGDSEPEVGLLELNEPDIHPLDVLLGFEADATWRAVGVVAGATARHLAPGPGDPAMFGVRVTTLVGRDGTEASLLRRLDGSPAMVPEQAPEGRLSDACRRVLGCPTAPPPLSPLSWLTTAWLDALMAAVSGDASSVADWSQALALHPWVAATTSGKALVSPAALLAALERAGLARSWEKIRTLTASGRPPVAPASMPIAAPVADWMDDGMFARWLLAELPDPIDILIDLVGIVPAALGRQLVEVAEGCGVW